LDCKKPRHKGRGATEQEWDLSGECGDKPAALTPSQDFKTLYGANVVSLHGTVVRATEQAYASQRVALTRRALRMRTHALMSQPVQRKFPELWLNGHQLAQNTGQWHQPLSSWRRLLGRFGGKADMAFCTAHVRF
jgi:hypothetical protein